MTVSIHDFKKTLANIKEKNIRLKVKTYFGWSEHYLQIIGFVAAASSNDTADFKGIVLSNINATEGILINNICSLIAFELETGCEGLQPNVVYTLKDEANVGHEHMLVKN